MNTPTKRPFYIDTVKLKYIYQKKWLVNDAGVVISVVSAKNGEGYALVLDGSTFEEIARAKFPYGLPYGLHGCWVPMD